MGKSKLKVLVIDDDLSVRGLLLQLLTEEGYEVLTAEDVEEGLNSLKNDSPDFILCDVVMPGKSGLIMLKELDEVKSRVPVIIMTGTGSMRTAIEAAQFEAFEYIEKPFSVEDIKAVAKRASEVSGHRQETNAVGFSLTKETDSGEIIGKSAAIQKVFKQIGTILRTPISSPVLLLGEIGVGKDLIARVIHDSGSNKDEPLITVNCNAVRQELLESELFGTDAKGSNGQGDNKIGKIELAGGGSLLINEISEMSLLLQAKLLEVINEGRYSRLNSSKELKSKVRFIATANEDLFEKIKAKTFKEDLYYRLSTHTIIVPPLREREEDIPLLANTFLKEAALKVRKSVDKISEGYLERLKGYSFPGNVSELKNLIGQSVLNARSDTLLPDDLPILFDKSDREKSKSSEEKQLDRKLAAILFTDLEGFSRLMGKNEEQALILLDKHNQIVSKYVMKNNGQIIKYIGDAVMASFGSAVHATQCAIEIQRELLKRNTAQASSHKVMIRIGIHIGDVIINGGDVFGDGVNIASRIEPLSDPGGICISQDVYNLVRNQININTESIGQKKLKNIKSPVAIYKIKI